MDFPKFIDAFRNSTFDVDCREMVLTQNKAGGAIFAGPGFIKQNSEGTLTFKVYVATKQNVEAGQFLGGYLGAIAGKLHAPEEFYELSAKGNDGTQWSAQRVLPAPHWNISNGGVIVDGQMFSVTARAESGHAGSYLKVHFFEEFEIPVLGFSEIERRGEKHLVRDKSDFPALGFAFKARKHDGDTTFEVESEAEFPDAFHLRVQEALQYIAGKSAIWRARFEARKGELCLELTSPMRKAARTQFGAPILPAYAEYLDHGWRLFESYLAYVVVNTPGQHWNPVSYHLYNACEATANSIDSWAVGYSVAVEAISSLVSSRHADVEKRVGDFQARMRELLAAEIAPDDLKKRMNGLINALSTERVQDILYPLVSTGNIDPAYISAWSKLRNRHVHPKLKDLKKQDPAETQKLLDLIHKVGALLHQITFYLIRYEGPFTDYGAEGFPIKHYPLAVELPEPRESPSRCLSCGRN